MPAQSAGERILGVFLEASSNLIIGMLLTPPDVISQTLLAIPIWLLFELGILFSKFIIKDRYNKTDIMHDAIDTKDKKEDKN